MFPRDASNWMLELFERAAGRSGFIFLNRFTLYFQLNQASFQSIHRLRFGIDLHADSTGRLINQINRLIG